jgi:hypothetical protein
MKTLLVNLSWLVLCASICGCSYTSERSWFYPGNAVEAVTPENERWRDLKLNPAENSTGFLITLWHGQIPGWLGSVSLLVFTLPTERIIPDMVVPVGEANMWNVDRPVPGRGKIEEGTITILKVTKSSITLQIHSPELWKELQGRHKFTLGQPQEFEEKHYAGILE